MWEGRTNILIPITTLSFGIEIREELSLGTDAN